MNVQDLLVMLIVLSAVGYLLRQSWRTWSGRKAGCGGGCRCSDKPASTNGQATFIPAEQITLRRRD